MSARGPDRSSGPRWLVPAALLCSLAAVAKPPVIDEESYLWLGAHVDPALPYDWHRAWQPWSDQGPVTFVYAHPPLHLWWMALVHAISADPGFARAACAVPFVTLYAWGVGRLAAATTRRAPLACAAWLAASTVQLGLQDSLMIDLPAVALVTAGVGLYAGRDERGGLLRLGLAGLLLGLGAATKYSMGMVVVPVLLHAAVRVGRGRLPVGSAAALAAAAFAVPAAVEGVVAAQYGQLHLWAVCAHRHDIESGPVGGRALGALARMALLPVPLASPALAVGAVVVGACAAWAGAPSSLAGAGMVTWLVVCGLGAAGAAAAVRSLLDGDDRDDGLLLGGLVLATFAGVAGAHNFASARYLLPAAAPLAVVLARAAGRSDRAASLSWGAVVASALLAGAVSVADFRFAAAGDAVAAAGAVRVQSMAPVDVRFAGEWTFRYHLEAIGWQRYRPGEELRPGTLVLVADNESPGEFPRGSWQPVDRVEGVDRLPLKVMAPAQGIALYAETLGVLPLGWSSDPLESATVFRVTGAADGR